MTATKAANTAEHPAANPSMAVAGDHRGGSVDNGNILQLTDDNFDEKIQHTEQPILVDFWAAWCGPCRSIAPTLEQLAEEMSGQAHVAKVNVDESGELVNRFGIRSIPTLVVFKDGKVVEQLIGAAPKEQIRALLSKHIA